MGIYVEQHLKQMKESLIYRQRDLATAERQAEAMKVQIEDLNRGIRALEALEDQ